MVHQNPSTGNAPPAVQQYKPSRFNVHTTAPDGSLVLCNTFSGHTCVIPAPGVPSVRRYLSQIGFAGQLDELGAYLVKAGYVVTAEMDELAKWDVCFAQHHYRPDALRLVLFASEECNFRCVYCSQPFRRGTMEPPVREGVRRFIGLNVAKLRFLAIDWFGGEPLLGYEAIAELAPYLAKATEEHDVRYRASITTNGYLLTPDCAERLISWRILGFQITVDGLPREHNSKRPLRGGGPTFDRIMDNLKEMRELPGDFSVRLRVNYDRDNIETVPEYLRFAKDVLRNDPRFEFAFNPVDRWGGPNDEGLRVLAADSYRCERSLRQEAWKAGVPTESIRRLLQPGARICHASLSGGMNVGADGRVSKCTNHGAMPEDLNTIGRINQDGILEIDTSRQLRWIAPHYRSDAQCTKCFFLPICQGGEICVAARAKGHKPTCPKEKTHIRNVLLDYWQERLTRSKMLSHISVESHNERR